MELLRHLGIGQKATWYMASRMRQARDAPDEPIAGPVKANEFYFGGNEANEHKSKKLNAGRGAVGKTAVASVNDRANNRAHTVVVERTDTTTLTDIVSDSAEHGATVFADKWKAYNPLEEMGYEHSKVKHSVGQYVDGITHANGSVSFWSMMKRCCHDTYHQVSPKHHHGYVAELRERHNQRLRDMLRQMGQMVRSGNCKQTRYGELIAYEPHTRRLVEEVVA